MKSYTKWHAIIASFYSVDLYKDVVRRWTGIGFSYQLLLTTAMISSLIVVGAIMLNTFLFAKKEGDELNRVGTYIEQIAKQVPNMEWYKGILRLKPDGSNPAPKTSDIFFTIGSQTVHLAHINPGGSEEDLSDDGPLALLAYDGVFLRKSSGAVQSRTWQALGLYDFTFDAAQASQYGKYIALYLEENRAMIIGCLAMFLWSVGMLVMFMWRVLQSLAFGLVAKMFGSLMVVRMSYKTAVRLASVALTPVILIDFAAIVIAGRGLPILLFVIIATTYTAFAVRCNRSQENNVQ